MKAPRHSVVGRVWHGEGEELSAGVSCASFGCGNRDTQQQQQRIATGAVDGSVRVWLVNATGSTSETNLLHSLDGLRAPICSLAFSPGAGDLVAAAEHGGTFKMWDLQQSGSVVRTLKHEEQARDADENDNDTDATESAVGVKLVFHPYPAALCILSASKTLIKVWDYKKRACMWEFRVDVRHRDSMIDIETVSFTPDGNCVTFATFDGCLKIWEFRSNAIVATFEHGADERVRAVAYHPTELIIATLSSTLATASCTFRLWSIERAVEITRVVADAAIGTARSTLAFSLDATQLVHTCDRSLNVISWSSSTSWSSKPHVQSYSSSMAWSAVLDVSVLPSCRGLLIASQPTSTRAMELFICKLPAPLEAFEEPAPCIVGDLVASATPLVSYKASPTTTTSTTTVLGTPGRPAAATSTVATTKPKPASKSRAAPTTTHRTATTSRHTSANATVARRTGSAGRELDPPKENGTHGSSGTAALQPSTAGLIARDRRAATDRLALQSFLPTRDPASVQTPASPAMVSAAHADTVKLLSARLAHLQRVTEAKATTSDLASMLDSVSRTSPDVVNTIQLIRIELQQTATAKAQLQSCSNERLNKLLLLLKAHLQSTPRSPEAIKVVKLLATHAMIFKSCTLKPTWDELQRMVASS